MRSGDLITLPSGHVWVIGFVFDPPNVRRSAIEQSGDGSLVLLVREGPPTPVGPQWLYTLVHRDELEGLEHSEALYDARADVVHDGRRFLGVWNDEHPTITITQLPDGTFSALWRWQVMLLGLRGCDASPLDFQRAMSREARPEEV